MQVLPLVYQKAILFLGVLGIEVPRRAPPVSDRPGMRLWIREWHRAGNHRLVLNARERGAATMQPRSQRPPRCVRSAPSRPGPAAPGAGRGARGVPAAAAPGAAGPARCRQGAPGEREPREPVREVRARLPQPLFLPQPLLPSPLVSQQRGSGPLRATRGAEAGAEAPARSRGCGHSSALPRAWSPAPFLTGQR